MPNLNTIGPWNASNVDTTAGKQVATSMTHNVCCQPTFFEQERGRSADLEDCFAIAWVDPERSEDNSAALVIDAPVVPACPAEKA